MLLRGYPGSDALLVGADPASEVVLDLAISGNPLRASTLKKQSESTIRLGEHACLECSKEGRTNVI